MVKKDEIELKKQTTKTKNSTKKGRKSKKIFIGKTKNVRAAKLIYDSLLAGASTKASVEMAEEPKWTDVDSINAFFAEFMFFVEDFVKKG